MNRSMDVRTCGRSCLSGGLANRRGGFERPRLRKGILCTNNQSCIQDLRHFPWPHAPVVCSRDALPAHTDEEGRAQNAVARSSSAGFGPEPLWP